MFYELTDLLLQKTPEEIAKENKPPLCRPRHRTCCEQSRELIWDTFEKPETSFLGLFSINFFDEFKFSVNPFFRRTKFLIHLIIIRNEIIDKSDFSKDPSFRGTKNRQFCENIEKPRSSISFRYFLSCYPSAVSVWKQFHLLKKIIAT